MYVLQCLRIRCAELGNKFRKVPKKYFQVGLCYSFTVQYGIRQIQQQLHTQNLNSVHIGDIFVMLRVISPYFLFQ